MGKIRKGISQIKKFNDNTHVKLFYKSPLVIREIGIKSPMRYHFIPIRLAKSKGLKTPNVIDKAGDKSIVI